MGYENEKKNKQKYSIDRINPIMITYLPRQNDVLEI